MCELDRKKGCLSSKRS